VGDIISVIILESSSAKNLAGTRTDVRDDLGLRFQHTLQGLTSSGNNTMTGQASNRYSGSGQTTRGSTVQARITAWVTDVLPNGNLAIKGAHRVEVNSELQEINLTGIVRAKDISGSNTIFSYQVANAELSIKGTGAVAEAESPGWISRIFNWLF
jgi:flagellar L-ring protein precursor FlgH